MARDEAPPPLNERNLRCCASCRFWDPANAFEKGAESTVDGVCRRRAPVVTGGMMSDVQTVWPITRFHEWCGDGLPAFERKTDASHA